MLCNDPHNIYPDNDLYIGITTRRLLNRLRDEGDISTVEVNNFYRAVRSFYCTAADYAINNLPISDAVLQNANFLRFETREVASFSQVEFFLNR